MSGARIHYSAAEMRWLEANRLMVIGEYHQAFCAAFERSDVSAANLHALRKRKGWKIGPELARTRMVGRHTNYSGAEVAWLRDNSTMAISALHAAFCEQFKRTDITLCALNGFRKKQKWHTGRDGHFHKGNVPWSKGKKIGNNPGSARTQFKKGQLPHNTKHAGYEHVRTDGYVEISVDQKNPYTGADRRMVIKHRHLWQQQNGPIPEGMVLKCKGDPADADPSNWELVPRGVLPRLNGKSGRNYDGAPPELKPAIMAVARIEHRIHEKRASPQPRRVAKRVAAATSRERARRAGER